MYKVALVNMPFTKVHVPSIGLTQLRSALKRYVGADVCSEVLYLNHDVARYLGRELYNYVTDSKDASNGGLGDWFFRQAAFPDAPDNSEAYFKRYYPRHDSESELLKRAILAKRAGVVDLLDRLIDEYVLLEADLVGLASMFAQNVGCLALARRIKERNPGVVTVMGGANCESPMGMVLARRADAIDFVFSGPALKSFPELVHKLMSGRPDECHRIAGVFSRVNVSRQPPAALGDELDVNENIELDYESFLNSVERHFPGEELHPALLFETSRGCWWGERAHCTFCGLNGSTMASRTMAPERAIRHLEAMFGYADRVRYFEAVDNILPRSYPREVFAKLKVPAGVSIFYELKSDTSAEDIRILSESKVNRIQPGIEALATSTLKLMKKGSTAFQGIVLLKNCAMYSVLPAWNLLVGFPGERAGVYEKYVRDMPLLVHLPPPTGAFPVRVDRFSPYFMRAFEYGLNLRHLDYYDLTYPFEEGELRDLAYYFRDQNLAAPYFLDMAQWIDRVRRRADEWRGRWKATSGTLHPHLYFDRSGDEVRVYDSRGASAVEYSVGELGDAILQALREPLSMEILADRIASGRERVGEEVDKLVSRGLLFEESGRYLSLVQDCRPPEMDWPFA